MRAINPITKIISQEGTPYKARLGLINYINSLPFVFPIMEGYTQIFAETILEEPGSLNTHFACEKLDLGAMSAFSFLQQDNLALMPDISLSSQGAVGSVLFFSKVNIKITRPLRIAVPLASATSINLLSILLLSENEIKPVLIPCVQPDLANPEIDAALVIGDQALVVDSQWSLQYWRCDLGQWWYDTYSLPAVFGVFAVRKAWQSANQAMAESISSALVDAKRAGLTQYYEKVLDQAQARVKLPRERLKRYYQNELDYTLSDDHRLSLEKYKSLCRLHGLIR